MNTKTTSLLALLLGLFALAFTGVKSNEYVVDPQQSKINWVGRKVTGEHSGGISISQGKLIWNGKQLKGGSFEIDMNSITNTDITDKGYSDKLVGHLKADDFFATEKHPKANFVITSVTPQGQQSLVKGNLTIKGITKEVQFSATVQANGKQLTAKAKIMVDRTLFDIKYGSGSFFDNLGDKAIENEFELDVALVANQTVAQ